MAYRALALVLTYFCTFVHNSVNIQYTLGNRLYRTGVTSNIFFLSASKVIFVPVGELCWVTTAEEMAWHLLPSNDLNNQNNNT